MSALTIQPYDAVVAEIAATGAELAKQAEAFVIKTDDDDLAVRTVLATVTKGLKAADERRKEYKAPALAECNAIDTAFKTATAPWETAKKTLAKKAGTYFADKKRAEDEARAAAERAEREAIAARRAAEAKGEEPPVQLPAPVKVASTPSAVKTQAGTVGMVEQRDWEIVDEAAIPKSFWILDIARIGREIRSGHEIPGIRTVVTYVPRTR